MKVTVGALCTIMLDACVQEERAWGEREGVGPEGGDSKQGGGNISEGGGILTSFDISSDAQVF